MKGTRPYFVALLASVVLHGTAFAVLGDPSRPPVLSLIELDIETERGNERVLEASEGVVRRPSPSTAEPPLPPRVTDPGRVSSRENIDARTEGRGGQSSGALEFVLMSPRAEAVTLQDSLPNAFLRAQLSRLRVSERHASLEYRRATPNPSVERHVSLDDGHVRRRVTSRNPRRAGHALRRRSISPEAESPARSEAGTESLAHVTEYTPRDGEGPDRREVAAGVTQPEADGRSSAPRAAPGAPAVDPGPAATQAVMRADRPMDDRNASHVLARLSRSWVDATRRRGMVPGAGPGGVAARNQPASGETGRGRGLASATEPGPGQDAEFSVRDPGYLAWFHRQRRRLYERLRFPDSLALSFDQGTTVFRLRVRRDGSAAGSPRMIRSSGYTAFDQAAMDALRRSLPFAALPEELAPSMDTIPVTLSLQFGNPLVR